MISVIIVAYNEAEHIEGCLQNLQQLQANKNFEVLLADGGSTDGTPALVEGKARIVHCPKGKAKQMNQAAACANGDILFFIHADMHLPPSTLFAIEQQIYSLDFDGGGFANIFDKHNTKIKRLGTWLNFRFFDTREQSDRNIFYGDNGIFVRKEVFESLDGFKDIPIMEDYDFSIRLRKNYRVQQIKKPEIVVSARRHEKAGFLKTRLQWILIKKLYLLGVSPHWLARRYIDIR